MHHLVDRHQKIDGAALAPVDAGQAGFDAFGQVLGCQVGCQLLLEQRLVVEGVFLGAGLQKEVKRVVHRHFHHQIDGDLELARLLLKDQAALVVGKRILLPVDEVLRRFHLERIGNDLAAAMGCRAQTNHLRPQVDELVVLVVGDVVQGGVNGHNLLS